MPIELCRASLDVDMVHPRLFTHGLTKYNERRPRSLQMPVADIIGSLPCMNFPDNQYIEYFGHECIEARMMFLRLQSQGDNCDPLEQIKEGA